MDNIEAKIKEVKAALHLEGEPLPIAVYEIGGRDVVFIGMHERDGSPFTDDELEINAAVVRKILPDNCRCITMALPAKVKP